MSGKTRTQLLVRGIWPQITAAAHQARGDVAVAYFGSGASDLLPLKPGSRLVVDMSETAVKLGQTKPTEILKLLNRGVEVFTRKNLHAKMFVFSSRAFLGSANASKNSANNLVEAVVETRDRPLVSSIRTFIRGLAIEAVTPHYARLMAKLYRPPRIPGGKKRDKQQKQQPDPEHPPIKVVQLVEYDYSSKEEEARKDGAEKARRRLRNTRISLVDDFLWFGGGVRLGEFIVQVVDEGNKMVSPPGRVIHMQAVRGSKTRQIVFLEMVKKHKRKNIKRLKNRLSQATFKALQGSSRIRDGYAVHSILQQWAGLKLDGR